MGMFLKIDGVSGGSANHEHKGEIDVYSMSWGMSQSEVAHLPSRTSQSHVQDLTLVKFVDESSPKLQLLCLNGQHVRGATLSCTTGSPSRTYLKIELFDLVISSVSVGGSQGEDRFTENVSLNFSDVHYSYTTVEHNEEKIEKLKWNLRTQQGSVESSTRRL